MNLGEKIKDYRVSLGLTQKDLADKLFVTPQAVSRWEQGIVEPSLSTLKMMAEIFNVSVDEMLDLSKPVIVEETKEEGNILTAEEVTEIVGSELKKVKPVVGVCCKCKKTLYEGDNFSINGGRTGQSFVCEECEQKEKEFAESEQLRKNKKFRILGWVFGIIVAVAVLVYFTISAFNGTAENPLIHILIGLGVSYAALAFIYCMFANNTFIPELWFNVSEWGFVKFPGLIFSLDLDGIIWLITVKVLFFILGILLVIGAVVLATALCMVLAVFTFPFAVYRSYHKPEKFDNVDL